MGSLFACFEHSGNGTTTRSVARVGSIRGVTESYKRALRSDRYKDVSELPRTPIRAVDSGVVIQAGWNGGYGNLVTIGHGGGLTSSYAHQLSMSVSAGQTVQRGQVIGTVGSTGLSTGPHLHFEARIGGAPYSPRGWFGSGTKSRVCV